MNNAIQNIKVILNNISSNTYNADNWRSLFSISFLSQEIVNKILKNHVYNFLS